MLVHASCVADGDRGLLICGRPGAGKSRLALELIALGARLVADDQTALTVENGALHAAPAPRLAGLVEARGIGILRMPHAHRTIVTLLIDLDEAGTQRVPPVRVRRLMNVAVPLILRPESLSAAAVLAALRHGPPLDPDAPLSG
ncbi:MAG: HPr kinase/phosphorylase [Rubrimonas sp.]